jgi:hypothetical protein
MSYIVSGLDPREFTTLFSLDDTQLAQRQAMRVVVDAQPGFPCRISLDDAAVGERVILVNYVHQPANSPFRASHAIYLRENATRTVVENDLPPALRRRMLSLRAFDDGGMLCDATLVDGADADAAIDRLFARGDVAYIQAHYAAMGCYAARITRGY